MSIPINILDVNVESIELKNTKDDKVGKMFSIYHNGVKGLEVLLPEMNVPFGAKIMREFGIKVSVPLSFDGMQEDTSKGRKLNQVHAKLVAIQEHIRSLIDNNAADYFVDLKKKKPTLDQLNERVNNFIVPSVGKDGKVYADLFRTEIQLRKPSKDDFDKKSVEELEELRKGFGSKMGLPLAPPTVMPA